jgi:hypothetical protein
MGSPSSHGVGAFITERISNNGLPATDLTDEVSITITDSHRELVSFSNMG